MWADLGGDGRKELLNAPLLGAKSVAPTCDQDKASLFWYSPKVWKRHVVAADIPGIIHRVRPVMWDGGTREQFLVASFEGVALYRSSGIGDGIKFEKQLLSPGHVEKAPRLGASDAGVGRFDGRRFVASVEPWHGNEVVVYTDKGGRWTRRVIFDKVTNGTRSRWSAGSISSAPAGAARSAGTKTRVPREGPPRAARTCQKSPSGSPLGGPSRSG